MDVTATEFIKVATKTAEHFGFKSIDKLKKSKAIKRTDPKLDHTASAQNRRIDALHGMLTAGAQVYFD